MTSMVVVFWFVELKELLGVKSVEPGLVGERSVEDNSFFEVSVTEVSVLAGSEEMLAWALGTWPVDSWYSLLLCPERSEVGCRETWS